MRRCVRVCNSWPFRSPFPSHCCAPATRLAHSSRTLRRSRGSDEKPRAGGARARGGEPSGAHPPSQSDRCEAARAPPVVSGWFRRGLPAEPLSDAAFSALLTSLCCFFLCSLFTGTSTGSWSRQRGRALLRWHRAIVARISLVRVGSRQRRGRGCNTHPMPGSVPPLLPEYRGCKSSWHCSPLHRTPSARCLVGITARKRVLSDSNHLC